MYHVMEYGQRLGWTWVTSYKHFFKGALRHPIKGGKLAICSCIGYVMRYSKGGKWVRPEREEYIDVPRTDMSLIARIKGAQEVHDNYKEYVT